MKKGMKRRNEKSTTSSQDEKTEKQKEKNTKKQKEFKYLSTSKDSKKFFFTKSEENTKNKDTHNSGS